MARDDNESAKVENIVSRFFSKCIHVILESRYKCNNAVAEKDKWFNLVLRDSPPELNIHNTTGVCSSTHVVVDLVLLHHQTQQNSFSHGESWRWDGKKRKVIERWVMMFEEKKGRENDTGSVKGYSKSKTFYKKCVLMMRSLYSMIRLLPAYKLFRELTASRKPCEFSIGHHISSFAEPFTREEEAQMQKYFFVPVETSCGCLYLSVLYKSSLVNLKIESSYQVLPHVVIPDYCVGASVDDVCTAPILHGNGKVTIRSHSLDAPSHPAKTSPCDRRGSLDCLRSEVGHGHSPIELGDPFQPRLSDNAALGSMFSIFHEATPLRRSSRNKTNLPGASVVVPTNPRVKTTLDALRELQCDIEFKNRILQTPKQ